MRVPKVCAAGSETARALRSHQDRSRRRRSSRPAGVLLTRRLSSGGAGLAYLVHRARLRPRGVHRRRLRDHLHPTAVQILRHRRDRLRQKAAQILRPLRPAVVVRAVVVAARARTHIAVRKARPIRQAAAARGKRREETEVDIMPASKDWVLARVFRG